MTNTARVIGHIESKEMRVRIQRSQELRHRNPLRLSLGVLLKEAFKNGRAKSTT